MSAHDPEPEPSEVLGSIIDLRASREPLTPEELELHELRESIKAACAKGRAHVQAIIEALGQATDSAVLVLRPVDFHDATETTKLRTILSQALGCGIVLFPSSMNEVFTRAVEVARAEVREAAEAARAEQVN